MPKKKTSKKETSIIKLDLSEGSIPKYPVDLHWELEDSWNRYWTSNSGKVADPLTDYDSVVRLYTYKGQWLIMNKTLRQMQPEEWVVLGSRHAEALKPHPYFKLVSELENKIALLEKNLGLTPLARARLGIEIANQKLTWNEVSNRVETNSNETLEVPTALKTEVDIIDLPVGKVVKDED